jgi:hypothetical protein
MSACLLVLTVPSFFAADDLPEGWGKLSSPAEGFYVVIPGEIKRQKLTDKGPDDKPVKLTFFRTKHGGADFIVGMSEFSHEYMSQPKKKIFDNARDGSIARSGGKLVREKDIKQGKLDGREVVNAVGGKDGGVVIARIFVANGRQYSVMVAGKKLADVESEDALRFLDSFKAIAVRTPKGKPKG